jgi:hypothetical protein
MPTFLGLLLACNEGASNQVQTLTAVTSCCRRRHPIYLAIGTHRATSTSLRSQCQSTGTPRRSGLLSSYLSPFSLHADRIGGLRRTCFIYLRCRDLSLQIAKFQNRKEDSVAASQSGTGSLIFFVPTGYRTPICASDTALLR